MTESSIPLHDYRFIYVCPNSLPPRLFVNGTARVVSGLGANNLRTAADESAEILSQIPEGAELTVMGQQVCVNGMNWWYVRYGEIEGWTAEGQGQNYWLEPIYHD
jgi:hypothetical protein